MAERLYTQDELITLAATTSSRLLLARALGQTAYEGERDYYETLGYPPTISVDDYIGRYERQDIAGRVVDLPAQDTWKRPPLISEDDNVETAFVKAWEELEQRLRVFSYLMRVDRLSGIGRYGVLLVGVRNQEGVKLSDPVEKGKLSNGRDILYLRPFSEASAEIKTWDSDTNSERYGLPLTYSIKLSEDKADVQVHWTRVLHIAEDKLDSEVYGRSRLQRVYNRLDDLMKIVGGAAEATWLNMRPLQLLTTQEGYGFPTEADGSLDDDYRERLIDEVRKAAHDVLRMTFMEGIEPKAVEAGPIPDVRALFDVTIACIAAASGIPQRVLLGSAQGELSAAKEDMRQWAGAIASRQANYAEPEILRPCVDRLIWLGALPAPSAGQYDVGALDADGQRRWPPLVEMTEEEQSVIMRNKAVAVKALTDPATGATPLTDAEKRELLDYPAEREEGAEEEAPAEEPEAQPEGLPEETPEPEPGTVAGMVAHALARYRAGDASADDVVQYALTELVEVAG